MTTAVVNAPIDPGPVPLARFEPEDVIGVRVTHGHWVVFAKVVLQNLDGDDQNSTVTLLAGSRNQVLDQSNARIPGGGNATSFSMQGSFTVVGDIERFVLSCATFNGQAQQLQMMAISVDALIQSKP